MGYGKPTDFEKLRDGEDLLTSSLHTGVKSIISRTSFSSCKIYQYKFQWYQTHRSFTRR